MEALEKILYFTMEVDGRPILHELGPNLEPGEKAFFFPGQYNVIFRASNTVPDPTEPQAPGDIILPRGKYFTFRRLGRRCWVWIVPDDEWNARIIEENREAMGELLKK